MRRIARLSTAAIVLLLAACSDKVTQTSSEPTAPVAGPQTTAPGGNPYCTLKSASQIQSEIQALFIKNDWPDANSALGKFGAIQTSLAAGTVLDAQQKTHDLVAFIQNKFNHLTPAQQAASQNDLNTLIADLYCFVGISGTVYDLNPGDPARVFATPGGTAGVWFPPNAVPTGTMVAITDITSLYACTPVPGPLCGQSPLNTPLDKYPTYVSIELYPNTTFSAATTGLPVVAVCYPDGTPLEVLLGHQASDGFELLPAVQVPGELKALLYCFGFTAQRGAPTSTLARWMGSVSNLFLPQRLEATPMFAVGGVGGSPEEFSPFGAVDPALSGVAGAGGSPEEFAPPALGPAASASVKASAPATANASSPDLEGSVGISQTTGLPKVYVQTRGLDGSVNAVPGVTVIFSVKPASNNSPAGNASLCPDAQSNIPTQVTVLTGSDGSATLPCLYFGTTAGYSNLKARFDPSSLNFPGNALITITPVGATSLNDPDNSINFLVKADAGVPTALVFTTTPSSTAQAGVPLSPQPVVELRDAFNNPVPLANVDVTVGMTGGGSLGGTTTVKTDANGAATFTNVEIDGLVGARTLSFSFSGIITPLTRAVTVVPGPASKLALTTQPSSSAQAGVLFASQPVVQVQDQFGNAVSQANRAILAAITTGGAGTLFGTATVNSDGNGTATYSGLYIGGVTGDRTLTFSSTGLTAVVSNTISVSAGPATQLSITTQPSSTAQAGVAFATQPVVQLRDQYNNAVTTSGVAVGAAITSGGLGTLFGTTPVLTAAGGAATFSGLYIGGLVGNRTLTFTASGLTSVVSTTITITAGPAYAIAIVEGDNKSGAAYTAVTNPQPKVKVTDLYTNPVANAPVHWTPSFVQLLPPSVDPTDNLTGADGTAAVTSWILGPGPNTLLAETPVGSGTISVVFNGTGTITLDMTNACATGGGKDDITKYGFFAKQESKQIGAMGVNVSTNGAPGSSEDYLITMRASLDGGSTFPYSAQSRFLSSSNSSKGVESLMLFDFKGTPIPSGNGTVTVRLSAQQVLAGGGLGPLPTNRVVNMNVGTCSAGSKTCKGTVVTTGVSCNITESQLSPFVASYRNGFAARIYVIR